MNRKDQADRKRAEFDQLEADVEAGRVDPVEARPRLDTLAQEIKGLGA
jgi:hypothetical protein